MLLALFQYFRNSYFPLAGFKLRAMRKSAAAAAAAVVPFEFVKGLAEVYGGSLRRVSFVGCEVQVRAVQYLCRWCVGLERVDLGLNPKEVVSLGFLILVGMTTLHVFYRD